MSPSPTDRSPRGEFARARADAAEAEATLRARAVRAVAGNSRDARDRHELLAMLGLPDPVEQGPGFAAEGGSEDETLVLARALKGYVRAVADVVGVAPEGTSCEVTDTATAYLALTRRRPEYADRDLMLVWSERQGWVVSVETRPAESPIVLSRLGGDTVPAPEDVARFVTDVVGYRRGAGLPVAVPGTENRRSQAERMNRYLGPP
ncbi:DUF6292 family protein [Amycolatopsis sp. NPDC059021]|uniref:DUF6292 family protein n=1 Tax=Amycolatopsis sp. NPDC059021 TaxID=3346704 RepID=UPI00366D1EA9